MLELLSLSVVHDRPRLSVGLDRQALLVPADRFRLFGQRSAEAGEGPGVFRELCRGLVVLIESHGDIFPGLAQAETPSPASASGPRAFDGAGRKFMPIPRGMGTAPI